MSDYKVADTELTGIANAIRTKGGTQTPLIFPTGFVSAIQAIPTGGGGDSIHTVEYLECHSYGNGDPDSSPYVYDETIEPILKIYYPPTGYTRVVMEVSNSERFATYFGMWDNGYNSSAFGIGNDGEVMYFGYVNYGGGTGAPILDGNAHTITVDKNVAKIDGETIKTWGSEPIAVLLSRDLCLFSSNRYSPRAGFSNRNSRIWGPTTDRKFRLISCKIYDDYNTPSVLVSDMVPIRATIDNNTIYGVYDRVRKMIFPVNHNSNFTVGPDTGTI